MDIVKEIETDNIEWEKLSERQFLQVKKTFYDSSTPETPHVIWRYVTVGLQLADACVKTSDRQMQEDVLLEVFSGLHAAASNTNRHITFRFECLREINRVLERLSLFYKYHPDGEERLVRVSHIMTKTRLQMYEAKNEYYGW